MVIPVVACLLLYGLAQAVGLDASVSNREQSLMSLVVNQAVQLQQLATQQQQQAAKMQEQTDELRSLRDKVKSVETHQEWNVAKLNGTEAFRAFVTKPVVANAHIRFHTDYITGEGQLNPHTGVYTVATPGVYLLGFQLFPSVVRSFLIDLFISGTQGIRSRCFNSRDYTTSCSASSVFHLRKGDTVWLQSEVGEMYWGLAHSYIFGVLISPNA